MQQNLGPYRILNKVGEGGMGVVYVAHDPRLGRSVALKTVRADLSNPETRERLRREARLAASINHPNICQLYEIGDDNGELFIAMELLEGEPLSARIERGPLSVREAVRITLDILSALAALHRRGILHRDLKPSNVFLTEHGPKVLDFGVARVIEDAHTMATLTGGPAIIGTPRYMAPEQASGAEVDARADLFAVGAILYEMLAGRPAFAGDTTVRVLHAVMYEQPPLLTGSAVVAAIDRLVHRAMAKQPSARPPTAEAFAQELRSAAGDSATMESPQARPVSRLIVLPFRLLRPDAETDFLAFSLADAVTNSLSGLGSLVVRSSQTAAQLGALADLQTVAREADVDVVLTGTLLRAGEQMRLTAQLSEAPGGAVLWSHVMQVSFSDIFQLHDALVQKLIDALSISLTAREHRMLGRDVPASPKAYESYLRANELAKDSAGWNAAIEQYRKCVEQDPQYAPAWGRLGYVYRLVAKYRPEDSGVNRARAEDALRRALALNPDLPIAHKVVAQLEVESGRAIEALARLLRQASHASDPELFAGLCHACRYCGLLDASVAAHEQARRLDPKIPTSVMHTWFLLRNFERVLEAGVENAPVVGQLALFELGRKDEALALLRELPPRLPPRMRQFIFVTRCVVEAQRPDDMSDFHDLVDTFADPEGLFYIAQALSRLGEIDLATKAMTKAVDLGYYCYPAFASDPWLDPLRGRDEFEQVLGRAKERHLAAVQAFKSADGERIIGTLTR